MSYIKLITIYTKKVAEERGASKARVFFLRSLLFSAFSFKWLRFIDEFYKSHGFKLAPWALVGLPIRAYVVSGISISKRTSLLINHYKILSEFLNEKLLKKILSGEIVNITTLTAKNGDNFNVGIGALDRYWREGGLTIFMTDEEGGVITTLTFNLSQKENGDNFMIIGGLQGTTLGKSKIVSTTRMLNGLRPKYAVLEASYGIASIFNVKSILVTSVANHVFRGTSLMKKIHADYDAFWEENGGVKGKDKNYQLPIILPKRTLEDVPSKKKKDWLKRQEYLEQIKNDSAGLNKS